MLATIEIEKDLAISMRRAMTLLKRGLLNELRNQGHYNTGRLEKETEIFIESKTDEIFGAVKMLHYAIDLNEGVSSEKISGRSNHIAGLFNYFKSKGLSGKELKRASFATNNQHKKEGMPTRASMRFSNNNRRINFVRFAYNDNFDKMMIQIEEGFGEAVSEAFIHIIGQRV